MSDWYHTSIVSSNSRLDLSHYKLISYDHLDQFFCEFYFRFTISKDEYNLTEAEVYMSSLYVQSARLYVLSHLRNYKGIFPIQLPQLGGTSKN